MAKKKRSSSRPDNGPEKRHPDTVFDTNEMRFIVWIDDRGQRHLFAVHCPKQTKSFLYIEVVHLVQNKYEQSARFVEGGGRMMILDSKNGQKVIRVWEEAGEYGHANTVELRTLIEAGAKTDGIGEFRIEFHLPRGLFVRQHPIWPDAEPIQPAQVVNRPRLRRARKPRAAQP